MSDFTVEELEGALRRAFVDRKADYIFIDDRRKRFLFESAALGVLRGWLVEKFVEHDEQSSQIEYRLTLEGRVHFGL